MLQKAYSKKSGLKKLTLAIVFAAAAMGVSACETTSDFKGPRHDFTTGEITDLKGAKLKAAIHVRNNHRWKGMVVRTAAGEVNDSEPDTDQNAGLTALVDRIKDLPVREMLTHVKRYTNSLPYKTDKDTYGKRDYWATPEEFLQNQQGDCEDYAILSRHILLLAGVPERDLRFFVGMIPGRGGHAFLTVDTPDGYFVLDNINRDVVTPARLGYKFIPYYSINAFAGEDDGHDFWIYHKDRAEAGQALNLS